MNKTITIQFVNYYTGDYLRKAIDSVRHDLASCGLDYTIAIFNNSPKESLPSLQESNVTIIQSDVNIGFGSGHNKLMLQSSADYTLILNPDIEIIQPVTIVRMIESLHAEADGGCLGVRLLDADNIQQGWDHGELDFTVAPESPTSFFCERTAKAEVAWVSGAAMLFDTDTIKSVDGFDEKFFLYKEEEDLCLRLRGQDLKTYYDPTISILHHGSVVADKESPVFTNSIAYYDHKHSLDNNSSVE